MSTKFYEEECLPAVKGIASNLEFLCENSVDKDDLEAEIENIITEWQDELQEAIEETEEDINPYDLEGEDLLNAMTERGVRPNESDIDDYNDLCDQLKELEDAGASSLSEYFEDYLDVEYTIDSRGNYLGACVWVTTGGPSIWVDTRDRAVKLAWGIERAEWGISSETADKIDGIFEDQYSCLR